MDGRGDKTGGLSSYSLSTGRTMDGGRGSSGDFPIPDRYYVNALIVLPVNPSLIYFYWDMDIDTEERISRVGFESLVLVVYVVKGGDRVKISEIRIAAPEGCYYLKRYLAGEMITAQLGVEEGGEIIPVCYGNIISVPRDTFSKEEAEMIWMKRLGEGYGEGRVLIETSLKKGEAVVSSSEQYKGKIIQELVKYLLDRRELLSSDYLSSSFQQTRSKP